MAFSYHSYNGQIWSVSDRMPVRHLFTARLGDVGDWPYSKDRDEDWLKPERQKRVRDQWLNLCEGAALPEGLCFTHQVHGTTVRYVSEADRCLPPLPALPADCDGLCTDRPDVPLVVFTADCIPVLLCDSTAGAVAALHCGWRGTAGDMAAAGVAALEALGGRAERMTAAIGPGISCCCFETGPEVPAAMEALLGADGAAGVWQEEEGVPGKFLVDLKEVNRRRLVQLGVPADRIDVSADCTKCSHDLYWSHRATGGVRGTQAAIIMLRPAR